MPATFTIQELEAWNERIFAVARPDGLFLHLPEERK